MAADLATALSLVLTGPAEAPTAAWAAVFLAGSLLVGLGLGRRGVEGAALGLLTLAGAANLALYLLRDAHASVAWHLPLTAVLAVLLTGALRRWILFPSSPLSRPITFQDLVLPVLLAGAFWALRMVQVNPSSGLSSQLGWVPLYMRDSFQAGRFLLPDDFLFGVGPAGSLIYAVDMLGLVALAGGLGADQFYPPYLATSILGVGLALLLPLAALRRHAVARLAYVVMLAALALTDFQFRAAVARHWGDTVMILGGTLIMTALARGAVGQRVIRTAAAASVFLVLARHYAALFSGVLLSLLAVQAWWRRGLRAALAWWPLWLAAGGLLGIMVLRELNYVLHPAPFYPGGRLLAMAGGGLSYHLRGFLHDWGLMSDGRFLPAGPRAFWLWALLAFLVVERRRLRARRLLVALAPVVVMVLPLVLEVVTGYRTSAWTNKPYLVAVLFGAFYPAFILRLLLRARSGRVAAERAAAMAAAVVVAWALAGSWAGYGPGRVLAWARNLYDGQIVDRGVALALAAEGVPAGMLASRPIMYFYCEPGMGLRNYIGGSLRRDVDYWAQQAQTVLKSDPSGFVRVMAAAGWPNLYLSSRHRYGDYVEGGPAPWPPELDALESQPWVERVVRFGEARFVVVRPPSP